MAVFLSPVAVILQYFTDQGIILAGGKVYTYLAGTSQPVATFTDITGTVANSNPIVLDSTARLPNGVSVWQTGGQAIKAIFTDSNNNPIGQPIDQIMGINDTTSLTPLIDSLVQQAIQSQDTSFFTNIVNNSINSTITQSFLGGLLYPRTQNEINVNVVPTNLTVPNGPLRYGAKGDGVTDDSPAWNAMGKVNGIHIIPDGSYLIKSRVSTLQFASLHGWTRQNTILQSAGINDYMLVVGSQTNGFNPNVGLLENMKFISRVGDGACLFMNSGSHMWRLNDLVFQNSPCPGLYVHGCEDSNYTNIDMLSVGGKPASDTGPTPNPQTSAALIVDNGSNNIYFRGLRIEQSPVGCMSFSSAASIFIDTGKCDQGFITQSAPVISIDLNSQVDIDNYTIEGANSQYPIQCAGNLTLGDVTFEGGTNTPAHINDTRAWDLINGANPRFPGYSVQNWGPFIPSMNLGRAHFYKTHPSVSTVTFAAVNSKQTLRIPVGTNANIFTVVSSTTQGSSCLVGTTLPVAFNNQYVGCYLVHNPTGTKAIVSDTGSRRLIQQCFVGGNLIVQGPWGCTPDADWSLEYSGGHFTQIGAEDCKLDTGMTLFYPFQQTAAGVNPGVTINNTVGYSNGQTVYGVNTISGLPGNTDLTGYYLVDDENGEPYLITGGLNSSLQIGVAYDTTGNSDANYRLNTAHSFSIYAGYYSGVKVHGDSYIWDFAGVHQRCPIAIANSMGFDERNIPLWGCGFPMEGKLTMTLSDPAGVQVNIFYTISDHIVSLHVSGDSFGTSTSNNMSMGPLPLFLIPKTQQNVLFVGLHDNGNRSLVGSALVFTTGTIAFVLSNVVGSNIGSASSTSFTASGSKGIQDNSVITYSLN